MNFKGNKIVTAFIASAKELAANPKQWVKDHPATTYFMASLVMPAISAGMLFIGPKLFEETSAEFSKKAHALMVAGSLVLFAGLTLLERQSETSSLDIAAAQAAAKALHAPIGTIKTSDQPYHNFYTSWRPNNGTVSANATALCVNTDNTSAVVVIRTKENKTHELRQYTRPLSQGEWVLAKTASDTFVPSCGN